MEIPAHISLLPLTVSPAAYGIHQLPETNQLQSCRHYPRYKSASRNIQRGKRGFLFQALNSLSGSISAQEEVGKLDCLVVISDKG